LNAIEMSSPVSCASSDSDAWASSPLPASNVTLPSVKDSRIGVLRSATRATRRTDSISAAVSTVARMGDSSGSSDRYLGNSPSSRRDVVRRPAPSKPTRPSAPLPDANATVTLSAPASDFAVSARVRAGTSAIAERPDCSGVQARSRTARR
jgi:hypothetical protein